MFKLTKHDGRFSVRKYSTVGPKVLVELFKASGLDSAAAANLLLENGVDISAVAVALWDINVRGKVTAAFNGAGELFYAS